MVYVKSMVSLSLLLMELLAVTAKDVLQLNCKKEKGKRPVCKFGDPIEVSFRIEEPAAFDESRRCCNDRLTILDENHKDALWTHTCGFQDEYPGIRCPNFTSGKVIFDGVDPSEEGVQQWPLRPGSYRVCHVDFNWGKLQKCKKFYVELKKKDEKKIKKKAWVVPRKAVFSYGEDIMADFDAVVALPNTRVSIRGKTWKAGDDSVSVYAGCNNDYGDQIWSYYLSDDCEKTRKSGQAIFSHDNSMDDFLEGGEYEIHILYYNLFNWDENQSEIIEEPLAEFSVTPKPQSSKSPSSKSPSTKESSAPSNVSSDSPTSITTHKSSSPSSVPSDTPTFITSTMPTVTCMNTDMLKVDVACTSNGPFAIYGDSMLTSDIISQNVFLWTRDDSTSAWVKSYEYSNSNANSVYDFSVALDEHHIVIPSEGSQGYLSGVKVKRSLIIIDRTTGDETLFENPGKSEKVDGDGYGISVAISGDTIIVGANYDSKFTTKAGAAHIYKKEDGKWEFLESIHGETSGDFFGVSVDIEGSNAIVGASRAGDTYGGAAYLYTEYNGRYTHQTTFRAPLQQIGDMYGSSVAISKDAIAVGSPYADSSLKVAGKLYVYRISDFTLVETKVGVGTIGYYGYSVAMQGSRLAVSSYDSLVDLYDVDVMAETPLSLIGTMAGNFSAFGDLVGVSGNTVVANGIREKYTEIYQQNICPVSSAPSSVQSETPTFTTTHKSSAPSSVPSDTPTFITSTVPTETCMSSDLLKVDAAGTNNGPFAIYGDSMLSSDKLSKSVFLWTRDDSTSAWVKSDEYSNSNANLPQDFSFALDEHHIVIPSESSRGYLLGVKVESSLIIIDRTTGVETLFENPGKSKKVDGDGYGISVAISGDTIIIGANEDSEFKNYAGAAHIYKKQDGEWKFLESIHGETKIEEFGVSVDIEGSNAVVGAKRVGNNRGAAYLYTESNGKYELQKILLESSSSNMVNYWTQVAISDVAIGVGSRYDGSQNAGKLYVYRISDLKLLYTKDGVGSFSYYGYSVAMQGSKLAVSSRGYFVDFYDVDVMADTPLSLIGTMTADLKYFGSLVGVSGNTVVADGMRQWPNSEIYQQNICSA